VVKLVIRVEAPQPKKLGDRIVEELRRRGIELRGTRSPCG